MLSPPLAPSWPTGGQLYRACMLCTHGVTVDDERRCTCPAAVAPHRQQPVELVRRTHGPCGPEAVYLSFPGLHP